jgi:hypothetical protein
MARALIKTSISSSSFIWKKRNMLGSELESSLRNMFEPNKFELGSFDQNKLMKKKKKKK